MFSLLTEFIRKLGTPVELIVLDGDRLEEPRHHRVDPGRFLALIGGSVVGLTLLILALLLFTPIRSILPGYGSAEMRHDARLNEMRLQSIADSLALQESYVRRLRDMILGQVDTSSAPVSAPPDPLLSVSGDLSELPSLPSSDNWEDHEQPALSMDRLDVPTSRRVPADDPSSRYLSSLAFPVLPPVSGLTSRGFDARTGHYAVDIVVEEGSVVRSIGDGYVVMADWTHDGGQIIAVAHAGGFLSVYKHNQSLLKRVGDRVRDRDAIALSGNSGEITTGPHLHFELWHNGLAQDPRSFLIGL